MSFVICHLSFVLIQNDKGQRTKDKGPRTNDQGQMTIPLIIAHRGASAVAPENTLAAFKKALGVGAHGVEFDVRLSKDGIPVVIHDETLL